MKENSNKIFLSFFIFFYLLRDSLSKDLEFVGMIKGLRYSIILSLLYVILKTLNTIIILS